jgi:ATP-binding cassette subfamily G (WHITE) protein 2 (PDR)
MYRVFPLTYLVSGMFSVGVAHKSILRATTELIKILLPQSLSSFGTKPTCDTYLASFLATAGGRISNPDSVD